MQHKMFTGTQSMPKDAKECMRLSDFKVVEGFK